MLLQTIFFYNGLISRLNWVARAQVFRHEDCDRLASIYNQTREENLRTILFISVRGYIESDEILGKVYRARAGEFNNCG